jgi:hypothetical protein
VKYGVRSDQPESIIIVPGINSADLARIEHLLPVRYQLDDGALSGVYIGRLPNFLCIITGVINFLSYMGVLFWLTKS